MPSRNAINASSSSTAAATTTTATMAVVAALLLLLPIPLPSRAFSLSSSSPPSSSRRRPRLPNVVAPAVVLDRRRRRRPPRAAAAAAASSSPAATLRSGDDEDDPLLRGDPLSEGGAPSEGGGRRPFLSAFASAAVSAALLSPHAAVGAESSVGGKENDDFASIAARASKLALDVETAEQEQQRQTSQTSSIPAAAAKKRDADARTIYDFELPVAGKSTPVAELIGQEFRVAEDGGGEEGGGAATTEKKGEKVKAILVVNIKQDDPIARRNIPELISLASQYGRNGEFVVICSPTDQGYYEPDTSALIRLKLASEYGYGINPSTILTDKVNLLMSGAHPFWRWLENGCRTPMGLGRIQGNFEKFLVDGRTGKPLRRYPRKYSPRDVRDDLEALLAGKPLPPPGANYLEEWRSATKDSETDTYRFQKGLNVFDQ